MSETVQNIIGVVVLAAVFVLSRYGIGMRMRNSSARIIDELKKNQAFGPDSAVNLEWAKPNFLKFGIRDFRPKVLKDMVAAGVVGQTPNGAFYLPQRPQED